MDNDEYKQKFIVLVFPNNKEFKSKFEYRSSNSGIDLSIHLSKGQFESQTEEISVFSVFLSTNEYSIPDWFKNLKHNQKLVVRELDWGGVNVLELIRGSITIWETELVEVIFGE